MFGMMRGTGAVMKNSTEDRLILSQVESMIANRL